MEEKRAELENHIKQLEVQIEEQKVSSLAKAKELRIKHKTEQMEVEDQIAAAKNKLNDIEDFRSREVN